MSPPRSLGTVLRAMILAGLLAGGVLAIFHTVLTEPVIDQAVALEEMADAHEAGTAPLISRQQQKLGLVIGALLYGLFVGIIFGGVYYLSQEGLPARRVFANAALLALASYWLVGLFPFLKYPANPPGVGLPSTIEYRQAIYLSFIALSMVGGLLAANAARYLEQRRAIAAGYAIYAILLYLLMPAYPDPIELPSEIVTSFRLLSLGGLTIFWLVLGLSFGLLAELLEPDDRRQGFHPRAA